MTPLTITSTKQGIAYSETEAVAAFFDLVRARSARGAARRHP